MNRFRKAIAAGMTAVLLASLFTVIAASTALAAVTVTGGQSVPRGGTSIGAPVFTFTENSANCFPAAGANPALVYTITTPGVTFTGTATISRPDSLGATITSTSTSFSIKTLGQDAANIESMVVTGLKLKAASTAPLGAITATLTGDATTVACVLGTTTATGTLGAQVNVALTAGVTINVSSSCPFDNTATTLTNATFVTGGPDGRVLTAVTALAAGIQTATFGAGTAIHTIGQTVNQTVPQCAGRPFRLARSLTPSSRTSTRMPRSTAFRPTSAPVSRISRPPHLDQRADRWLHPRWGRSPIPSVRLASSSRRRRQSAS